VIQDRRWKKRVSITLVATGMQPEFADVEEAGPAEQNFELSSSPPTRFSVPRPKINGYRMFLLPGMRKRL
jgi:hypothetical protein